MALVIWGRYCNTALALSQIMALILAQYIPRTVALQPYYCHDIALILSRYYPHAFSILPLFNTAKLRTVTGPGPL